MGGERAYGWCAGGRGLLFFFFLNFSVPDRSIVKKKIKKIPFGREEGSEEKKRESGDRSE